MLLMTGKLNYRVDGTRVSLYTRAESGRSATKSGHKIADLEITIDLDELRTLLAREAMRTKSCRLTRLQKAIVVRPVKGSVVVNGEGCVF